MFFPASSYENIYQQIEYLSYKFQFLIGGKSRREISIFIINFCSADD